MNLYHLSAVLRHVALSNSPGRCDEADSAVREFIIRVSGEPGQPGVNAETERLRSEMLTDSREIEVTDLGTGRGRKKAVRRIKDIASGASLPRRQALFLSQLASAACGENAVNDDITLELGTCLGIGALTLSTAVTGRVVTVEGCPALARIARENLQRHNAANVTVINYEFTDALTWLNKTAPKVRFAFIDGNHTGDALKEYYASIMAMAAESITVVADDIHLSRSMYRAWKEIVDNNSDGLSVETTRFGIIIKNNLKMRGSLRIRC